VIEIWRTVQVREIEGERPGDSLGANTCAIVGWVEMVILSECDCPPSSLPAGELRELVGKWLKTLFLEWEVLDEIRRV
jgi:hypothetical protein